MGDLRRAITSSGEWFEKGENSRESSGEGEEKSQRMNQRERTGDESRRELRRWESRGGSDEWGGGGEEEMRAVNNSSGFPPLVVKISTQGFQGSTRLMEKQETNDSPCFHWCVFAGFDELKGVTEYGCWCTDPRRCGLVIVTSVRRRRATVTGLSEATELRLSWIEVINSVVFLKPLWGLSKIKTCHKS